MNQWLLIIKETLSNKDNTSVGFLLIPLLSLSQCFQSTGLYILLLSLMSLYRPLNVTSLLISKLIHRKF